MDNRPFLLNCGHSPSARIRRDIGLQGEARGWTVSTLVSYPYVLYILCSLPVYISLLKCRRP